MSNQDKPDQERSNQKQLSELYKLGANELPPEYLDNRILEQAIREASNDESGARDQSSSPVRKNWQWSFSAAVVVLASSIILDLHQSNQLDVRMDAPALLKEESAAEADVTLEIAPSSAPPQPAVMSLPAPSPATSSEAMSLETMPSKTMSSQTMSSQTMPQAIESNEMMLDEVAPFNVAPQNISPKTMRAAKPAHKDREFERQSANEEAFKKKAQKERQIKAERSLSAERKREQASMADVKSASVWIEEIDALLKQGRKDEALVELEEFLKEYPDYPLPDHLLRLKQGLLGKP